MKIKEVRITGFRSYKDNTHVTGFSPRSNVVVGRNGSGKSNFFHAIQFVLADEYAHLKEEQRLGLLHESTGPKVAHARVEIIFDNSEKRLLAFDNAEVKIVRQIGKKKDQYYIDNKMVPRAEVVNLMESAGFSRSNPYYIVKQGKINELATSPDAYKLKLLREVAGTRVYDERKEESLKILRETKMKTEKIQGLLKYIDERLQTLENEKEDLKEYQRLDKTKRSIEYTMYDNTNKEAIKEKAKLDEQKLELQQKDNDVKGKLAEVLTEKMKLDTEKKKLEVYGRGLRDEKETLQAEQNVLVEEQMSLHLDIESLTEENKRERDGRNKAEESLVSIKEQIAENQMKLDDIKPAYEKLVEEESRLITDIRIDESSIKDIIAKTGQRSQFGSEAERDSFLRGEIRRYAAMIDDNNEQVRTIEAELESHEKDCNELNATVLRLNQDIEENRLQMDSSTNKTPSLKTEYDKAYSSLQESSREEKQIRDKIVNIEQDISACSDQLKRLIAKPIHNGINNIQKVFDEFRRTNTNGRHDDVFNGYHGKVIDLVDIPAHFTTAVEIIAQNRLFSHVVDTDRIGQKILDKFNEMQLPGELQFLPINRLLAPREKPLADNANYRTMSSVIDHDYKFEKIIRYLTANVVIVRSLDEEARRLRAQGYDVVSVDGDKLARNGVVTGGFMETKHTKLEVYMRKNEFTKLLAEEKKRLEEAELRVRERTQNVERIRAKISQNENQISDFHRKHRQLTETKNAASQNFFMNQKMKEPKKQQLLSFKNRLRELLAQKEMLEKEVGTEMTGQMTEAEKATLETLKKRLAGNKEKLERVSRQRMDKMHEKNAIDNLLSKKLYKTMDNLSAKVDDISHNERCHRLNNAQAQQKSLLDRLKTVTAQLAQLNTDLSEFESKLKALDINIENYAEQLRDLEKQQADFHFQHEKIQTKEDEVKQKREDSLKKEEEKEKRKKRQMGRDEIDIVVSNK